MNYVSACEAKKLLHINGTTLKVWKDKGIIKYKKFTNKKYIYDVIISQINNKNNILNIGR